MSISSSGRPNQHCWNFCALNSAKLSVGPLFKIETKCNWEPPKQLLPPIVNMTLLVLT